MQFQTAMIGDCQCYPLQPPVVTFDRTKPVCEGTVCGDVTCGESVSCATGENQTTTVACNWGGWKKQDQYKYVPIMGGS